MQRVVKARLCLVVLAVLVGAPAAFAAAGEPQADVELLAFADQLLKELGITGTILKLNTLGDPETRAAWRDALYEHFRAHTGELSEGAIEAASAPKNCSSRVSGEVNSPSRVRCAITHAALGSVIFSLSLRIALSAASRLARSSS